jgi:amino acid adenylation domain-containing protein/thioester reductase-like protein
VPVSGTAAYDEVTSHPPTTWNETATGYPAGKTIPELFDEWARRTPDAVALRGGGHSITYAELDAWSNRLATGLVAAGVSAGEPVGLLGERCLEAPVAELGILKSGAAYVPLDPADPPARRQELVTELGITRMVTLPGTAADLPTVAAFAVQGFRSGVDPGHPGVDVRAGDLAYVLFTSGASGVPKAVAVAHQSVVRLVRNTNYVSFSLRDQVAATGYLAFDASVFEVWGALLNGACLVVVDSDTLLDPPRMERLLQRDRISVLWLSAGVFHHLANARPAMFGSVRYLITGGDVLAPEVVRKVLRAGAPGALVNGYGPTENTAFSATYLITAVPPDMARIPIGRPVANSTCYVVAEDGGLAAIGQEGELWVGGAGVASGYVNDAELTRRQFVPDVFGRRPGGRLFRTGDWARWLPDGELDFLGRRDRMVKLRGFRIELDEVEAALRGCPGVLDAAAVVVDTPAGKVISAYYAVPDGAGAAPRPADLRALVGARLPPFMIPGRFVRLDRLPLTASGKVDRLRLDAAARTAPVLPVQLAVLPASAVQVGLARLWQEVLGAEDVRPEDDFFDLGGNSLLAATIFARLRTMFGIDPRQNRFLTRRLLADPTLRACAQAVQEARDGTLTRDESGSDLDFWQEARRDIPMPAAGRYVEAGVPAEILLTGGTGFLGTYLLRELLNRTRSRVHCLVRAGSDAEAWARLADSQHRYGLGELPPDRVVAYAGDLGRPRLGWDEQRFDDCARRMDLILHSGAYVNFTYPYAHLAPVTVGGTAELIRLAGRHRGTPVHFVSTLAVLAGFGAAGVRTVTESTPLDFPEHLYMGYTETKWVAEQVLVRARAAALPVAIHRPYEISGDLSRGAWNLESATCALFKIIADSGFAPDIDLALDLVPVDVLAAQIVHIALSRTAVSDTYHLANPRPAALSDMVSRLRENGYPIQTLPFAEWVNQVVLYSCDHPEHPFTPFVPLWVDRCPRNGLILKEMFFARYFPAFDRGHAEAALAGAHLEVPPVDTALLDHYIRFFQRAGYLAEPVGVGR